jgi:hypothetical protein
MTRQAEAKNEPVILGKDSSDLPNIRLVPFKQPAIIISFDGN